MAVRERQAAERSLKEWRSSVQQRIKELDKQRAELVAEEERANETLAQVQSNAAPAAAATTTRRKPARRGANKRRKSTRATASNGASASAASSSGASASAAKPAAKASGSKAKSRRGKAKRGPSVSVDERRSQLLKLLFKHPRTRAEISESLGVSAARVQQLMDPLAKEGLVKGEQDPSTNRRRTLWESTTAELPDQQKAAAAA